MVFLQVGSFGRQVDGQVGFIHLIILFQLAQADTAQMCIRDRCDSTRMSTAAFLRGALASARDYGARKAAANGDVTKMPAYKMCIRDRHEPQKRRGTALQARC